MAGPEGVAGTTTSPWEKLYETPLPKQEDRARANVANAPWAIDVDKLATTAPLPPAVFTNEAMRGPAVALAPAPPPKPSAPGPAAPPPAKAPPPLAAAPDAYRGIRLTPSAGTLPPTDRTDLTRAVVSGPFKLFPAVRKGPDGAEAIVFYKAVNRESGRAEFIVGPGSLAEFERDVSKYAEIGLKVFAFGDPDGGGTASMRVMQTAMDKGFIAALKEIPGATLEASKDPKWVTHTVVGIATAAVPATRAEAAVARTATAAEAEASRAVGAVRNINIDPAVPLRGSRTVNCANCAVATDATLAGRPACALAGEMTSPMDLAAEFPGRTWAGTSGPAEIEAILTKAGPGSRGIIAGSRGVDVPGHFFNVVNDNGTIRFLDGQSGGIANLNDGYVKLYLLRTN